MRDPGSSLSLVQILLEYNNNPFVVGNNLVTTPFSDHLTVNFDDKALEYPLVTSFVFDPNFFRCAYDSTITDNT